MRLWRRKAPPKAAMFDLLYPGWRFETERPGQTVEGARAKMVVYAMERGFNRDEAEHFVDAMQDADRNGAGNPYREQRLHAAA